MKYISSVISIIFHPLFILTYILVALMLINPYLFSFQDAKAKGLIIISTFLLSAFFPIVAIAMMKALGLIRSFHMPRKNERIGPILATSIFYLWLYLNIKDNTVIPGAFSFIVLGSTIAIFLAFFLNIFHKVSLHSVGVGGLLMGIILLGTNFSYGSFLIQANGLGAYKVNMLLLYIILVLITGLTLSSRLFLQVHQKDEVYGGFFIGAVSQFFAYMIFF